MSNKVRVRFAPSPTGPLHIGGVRTALYNYLFARKHKGDFILRIEDTDQTRFVEGAEKYIEESLNWLGLTYDEGPAIGGDYQPYRQSERKELYRKYADYLLENDKAYIAFDTPGELNAKRAEFESRKQSFKYDGQSRMGMKNSLTMPEAEVKQKLDEGVPYVIRIKVPEHDIVEVKDIIRGSVEVNSREIDDKVLFKSDGLPTYHLANVVDDYLMNITHVIRGEEWLPSAPLHVLLYEFLGWKGDMPQFAHMPLIMKPTGKGKLSKRDGDAGGFPVFPLEWKDPGSGEVFKGYRESGYFKESVINILAFLGWNPGSEKELYSLDELIQDFSLDKVGKSGAKFDPDKARWYNHQYMQQKENEELAGEFIKELEAKQVDADKDRVIRIVGLVKERVNFISEFWEQSSYFFVAPESYDPKVIKKRWKEHTPATISKIRELLAQVDEFNSQRLEAVVKAYIEKNELGFGAVMNPLRLCLVGSGKGVHLFDIMEVIGKEESLNRIDRGLNNISR